MTEVDKPRTSLSEAAYQRLRSDILSCRLAPGQRLSERQLAADTGFGTATLRAALTRLGQDGLVRTQPRSGYQVTPLTPKSIGDLLDVWGVVAPELIRRGHRAATPQQHQRIFEAFEEINRIRCDAIDMTTIVRLVGLLDDAFAALAAATGNDYFLGLVRRLSGDLARTWVIVWSVEPSAVLIGDGGLLAEINTEVDADVLAERAREDIAAFRQRVLDLVSRWPSVAGSAIDVLDTRA
ncbi:MAG: GntR family transcriptional regulator [Mycobacterium sp.]|nr:GntR family transcriptional regulator [Mycobacterium sp.]